MQTKSLYVVSTKPNSGGLLVSMGLMEILKSRINKIAFFRPIIENVNVDNDIYFMINHFKLSQSYEDAYGLKLNEFDSLLANSDKSIILELLIKKFKYLEEEYDFVLCESLNSHKFTSSLSINLQIARNFGSPIVNIVNAKNKTMKEIIEKIYITTSEIKSENCEHFATVVNRSNEVNFDNKKDEINILTTSPVYFFPNVDELGFPTILEIQDGLNCELLFGSHLRKVIKKSIIAAMSIPNLLEYLEDEILVIVPSDRHDVLMAIAASSCAKDFPSVAGILLTGNNKPDDTILKLIKNMGVTIPILYINKDTFSAAAEVSKITAKITPESDRKIALTLGIFESNTNTQEILDKLNTTKTSSLTPAMFEYNLFQIAKKDKKTIVLPEGEDERILRAAELLLRRDIVDIILLGNVDDLKLKIHSLGLDLSKAKIIDPQTSELKDIFANSLYEARKAKGMQLDVAKDTVLNKNYFGTMMVHLNYAHGLVSGAINTTADTIRPALQIIKTEEGISTVSSIFFMCLDTKVLVYGDCAVNQDPNIQELAQIALSSAKTAKAFGVEPKIAMLSYSTGESGSGEEVEKVRQATKLVKELDPTLLVEGPIQYDAAIDPDVAKTKLPNSCVAGKATVFIFPDLNTGNNTYKAVQRSSGAVAIGPILQGLKKPINDLSRGCQIKDVINTITITAIQAQQISKEV